MNEVPNVSEPMFEDRSAALLTPAGAAVVASEIRYRRLFETAQDGILLIDAATGEILDANPSFRYLIGCTHEELVGKSLSQVGLFLQDEASPSLFRQLFDQGNLRFENLPLQTRRGEWREIELVCNAYTEADRDDSKVIQCNVRDITERRLTERALETARARERHVAWALQRALTVEVAEDAFPGILVSSLYAPAADPSLNDGLFHERLIGGDFHDAFALPDGRIALVVADTLGKGVFASTRSMQIKDMLRALARDPRPSPADVVTRLNHLACITQRFEEQDSETFTCLALAFLDPLTGEGELVSAGSELPVLLRGGGSGEVELFPIEEASLPLGVSPDETYTSVPLRLSHGDTLILMTDGITEARAPKTESSLGLSFLGIEEPVELAKKLGDTYSLSAMATAILEGARTFAGGTLDDDACLLLARRRHPDAANMQQPVPPP